MPKNKAQQRLSTVPDAADVFGCHPSTLRRYIATGRITGYRFGPRMLRVDLDEIEAMLTPLATAKNAGGAA